MSGFEVRVGNRVFEGKKEKTRSTADICHPLLPCLKLKELKFGSIVWMNHEERYECSTSRCFCNNC